jgi:hypothetical protein
MKNQSDGDFEILASHPWLRQEWGTVGWNGFCLEQYLM